MDVHYEATTTTTTKTAAIVYFIRRVRPCICCAIYRIVWFFETKHWIDIETPVHACLLACLLMFACCWYNSNLHLLLLIADGLYYKYQAVEYRCIVCCAYNAPMLRSTLYCCAISLYSNEQAHQFDSRTQLQRPLEYMQCNKQIARMLTHTHPEPSYGFCMYILLA